MNGCIIKKSKKVFIPIAALGEIFKDNTVFSPAKGFFLSSILISSFGSGTITSFLV